MSLTRRSEPLRLLAERLKEADFRQWVAKPGVNEGLRVSIQPSAAGGLPLVGTLLRGTGPTLQLRLAYDRPEKPLIYEFALPAERYYKLLAAFRLNKFDTLDDEPNLPLEADLWWIERAAGRFYHDVILCPGSAKGNHREVVLAIKTLLPELLRDLAL